MIAFYKKFARTFFTIAVMIFTICLIGWLIGQVYTYIPQLFYAIPFFFMLQPITNGLSNKGVPRIVSVTISMFILLIVCGSLLFFTGAILTEQSKNLATNLPKYSEQVGSYMQTQIQDNKHFLNEMDPAIVENIKSTLTDVSAKIGALINSMVTGILGTLTSVSGIIVNALIGLLLAFFLSLDSEKMKENLRKTMPLTFQRMADFVYKNVIIGISKYIKAQLILISFTFLLVLCGLFILQIENAFTLAFISAFFDILPVLGVPALFIPWIIYLLIVGQKTLAISLSVLLAIVMLFRQIAEPKILGNSLGVNPFVMLAFLIFSVNMFGIIGIFLSPVLLVLLNSLLEKGYIKKWIYIPEDEDPEKNS